MLITALRLFALLSVGHPGDPAPVSSNARLHLLPDGPIKRQFILDCTGCHQFDATVTRPKGTRRTRDEWIAAVKRMLGYAGATTGFPVIAAGRNPENTADWLSTQLAGSDPVEPPAPPLIGKSEIREYLMPEAGDLPHDVAVDAWGGVVVTGMFSHVMYRLDPTSGQFATIRLPVEKGGPRAVELDARGDWWVLLGAAELMGRYSPGTGKWSTWPMGMYPHSVALDSNGGAWFNGHFSRDPEVLARIDPTTGKSKEFHIPKHPSMGDVPGGPIPYEIRTGPDGRIWGAELQGNRIYAVTPASGKIEVYDLPTPLSGPRRFDIAPNGDLWIPAYANNRLIRFEPVSGKFSEYELPIPDALPYVARMDPARNIVWIGSGSADVALSFDLTTRQFTVFPLPSKGALVRHLSIDPKTHDLWLAYGASPGRIPARIARLRPLAISH
jgi:streptogramin lyase